MDTTHTQLPKTAASIEPGNVLILRYIDGVDDGRIERHEIASVDRSPAAQPMAHMQTSWEVTTTGDEVFMVLLRLDPPMLLPGEIIRVVQRFGDGGLELVGLE